MDASKLTLMKVSKIKTAEPFKSLFAIKADDLERIQAHMTRHGFDPKEALVLWQERRVLIDGHTRLEAAKRLGINEVPVVWTSCKDENDAILHAIHLQTDRRQLKDADIFRLTVTLDKRKKGGRPNLLASIDANLPKAQKPSRMSRWMRKIIFRGKSSEQTAKLLDTFPKKIENARYLLAYGSDELKARVLEGKMTIHAATRKTREELILNKIIIRRIPINGGKEYAVELSRKKMLQALKKVMTLGWSDTGYEADALVFQKDWIGAYQRNYEHMVFHPLATGLEGIIPPAPLIKMLKTLDEDLVRIRITDYGFEMTAEDHRKMKATLKLHFMAGNRVNSNAKWLINHNPFIAKIKWKPLPKDFLTGVRYCAYSVAPKLRRLDNGVVIDGIDILSADNKGHASWFLMRSGGMDGNFQLPTPAVKALSKFPDLTSYSLEDDAYFKNKDGIIFAVCRAVIGGVKDSVNQMKGHFEGPWLRTHDYPKEMGSPFTKLGIDQYDRILLRGENILHVVDPQQRVVYRDKDDKTGVIRGKWFAPIDKTKGEDDKDDVLFYNYGALDDRGFLTFYFPTEKEAQRILERFMMLKPTQKYCRDGESAAALKERMVDAIIEGGPKSCQACRYAF